LRCSFVPLQDYPIREDSRAEIAANQDQHPTIRNPLLQSPHQNVVVHTIKESLQIDIHDPATAILDVPLRTPYRVVRPAAGTKSVTVIGKRRVELWLQNLQQALLDESVEYRRNAKLALASAGLCDPDATYCLRLVASREEFRANTRPFHPQIPRQIAHRHPVDAGTPCVSSNSFQRSLKIPAFAHQFHQAARSWALDFSSLRTRFRTRTGRGGFTVDSECKLELTARLLRPGVPAFQDRFTLPLVRPFAGYLSPDYYGLC
jgi:hypothetical protein